MSSGLQHKMHSYEVTPPTGVWNRIEKELDDSASGYAFPEKLYNTEIPAPASLWASIASNLDAEKQSPVIPSRRAIAPWMKYAAAAIVAGALVFGGIKLLTNKTTSEDTATAGIEHEQTPSVISNKEPETNIAETHVNPVELSDDARDEAALQASKKTFAKLDISPSTSHKLSGIASSFRFATNMDIADENDLLEAAPQSINERYILLKTPDGHLVRMTKKLSNLVCCVSGEEQDKDCIDQMSKWKEKMACSPTGHSTGSFLDILSLIKSLEEK